MYFSVLCITISYLSFSFLLYCICPEINFNYPGIIVAVQLLYLFVCLLSYMCNYVYTPLRGCGIQKRYVVFSVSFLRILLYLHQGCTWQKSVYGTGIPDISRTGSTQKKCWSLIDGVKAGEAHDMVKVHRDGLQVDPPGIVAVLLHQVSEQELTHRTVLREARAGHKLLQVLCLCATYSTSERHIQQLAHKQI